MQDRHKNKKKYFQEQSYTTEKHVLAYIEKVFPIKPGMDVCEIGCGEAGNLQPFLKRDCKVVGIELSKAKIELAKKFFQDHPKKNNLRLIAEDIYHIKPSDEYKFDLIFLRDTLEHIPNQKRFLKFVKNFLKPNGKIFLGFPPWRMPFGGHQQGCKSKILSNLPYFHLLPKNIYKFVLNIFKEDKDLIDRLMYIQDTRISIQRYLQLLKDNNFKVDIITYYLINPNYEIKFKLKPIILPWILNIPYIRDFYTTALYSIISI